MATNSSIQVNRAEMAEFTREMKRMEKALDRKKINAIQRRNARPIEQDMKQNSPSGQTDEGGVDRIAQMVAITTRQTKRPRAPRIGIRIGVINNDPALFPDFSAPALASVLEYGTEERFREESAGWVVTGHASTGAIPESDKRKWLRKAWDSNVKQFVNKTERSYIKAVEG